jgi:hypothetical protein
MIKSRPKDVEIERALHFGVGELGSGCSHPSHSTNTDFLHFQNENNKEKKIFLRK